MGGSSEVNFENQRVVLIEYDLRSSIKVAKLFWSPLTWYGTQKIDFGDQTHPKNDHSKGDTGDQEKKVEGARLRKS